MNRFFSYALFLAYSIFSITPLHGADNQADPLQDDEVAALFAAEEDDTSFAQVAAQTSVMQQEIEIKPVSRMTLVARKIWDRILVFYLWCQQKYARVRVYLKARFNREAEQNQAQLATPAAVVDMSAPQEDEEPSQEVGCE